MNMLLNYKYFWKYHQILQELNTQATKLIYLELEINLKKITEAYKLYLYNLGLLVFIITGQFLKIQKRVKDYDKDDLKLGIILRKNKIWKFLDSFNTLCAPLFLQYNMDLSYKNFNNQKKLNYKFQYADPVFTSKNIVVHWDTLNQIDIKFVFSKNQVRSNFLLSQYLNNKFKIDSKQ